MYFSHIHSQHSLTHLRSTRDLSFMPSFCLWNFSHSLIDFSLHCPWTYGCGATHWRMVNIVKGHILKENFLFFTQKPSIINSSPPLSRGLILWRSSAANTQPTELWVWVQGPDIYRRHCFCPSLPILSILWLSQSFFLSSVSLVEKGEDVLFVSGYSADWAVESFCISSCLLH